MKLIKGDSYRYDNIIVMICEQDETSYIYHIAVMFWIESTPAQIIYAPIHQDNLLKFIEKSQFVGSGSVSDISQFKEMSLRHNDNNKTFFTIDIEEIIKLAFNAIGNRLQSFYNEENKMFIFPAIFPTIRTDYDGIHD